ncbi:N-dimethylarginine dimethylaminohydrolase [Fontibacillus solani]|uniref:N-dimethylarginine dimethylaminohydrolase n=1 Tax=Fontibacillus solani TaxID=1572857 RepID=A0A7W3SQI0_9BACL|nr:N-dimethylarginine dimethylaminohydrolase [Fontibacillus solani]
MPFLNTLIENLHYYVDVIIEYVQNVIKSGINIRSFEAVVYDCNIENEYHNNILMEHMGTKINKDNYKSLILGLKV